MTDNTSFNDGITVYVSEDVRRWLDSLPRGRTVVLKDNHVDRDGRGRFASRDDHTAEYWSGFSFE